MTTQLSTAHFNAPIIVLIALFSLCCHAHSTTVAVLQGKDGLIILADSKETQKSPDQTLCRSDEVKKIFVVHGRFAISALGASCLSGIYRNGGVNTSVSYNIDSAWVQELQSSLPKSVSMIDFVKSTEAKFSSLLPKLQTLLTSGYIPPNNPMDGRFETFISFVIVGYDRGVPTTCVLRFYIDWNTKKFIESSPWGGSLVPVDNMDMGFYVFGDSAGHHRHH